MLAVNPKLVAIAVEGAGCRVGREVDTVDPKVNKPVYGEGVQWCTLRCAACEAASFLAFLSLLARIFYRESSG